jgi:hypothetical protein
MVETCRVIHIQIENKNLSQVASVGLLIGILTKYYSGEPITMSEIGGACSKCGGEYLCIQGCRIET